VPGKNATLETQNTTRKVSDRITATESQTGVNDAYFIESLAFTLIPSATASNATINVVYGCEKVL
jgi:hypothetical protein